VIFMAVNTRIINSPNLAKTNLSFQSLCLSPGLGKPSIRIQEERETNRIQAPLLLQVLEPLFGSGKPRGGNGVA
jgi:hypothetical protein